MAEGAVERRAGDRQGQEGVGGIRQPLHGERMGLRPLVEGVRDMRTVYWMPVRDEDRRYPDFIRLGIIAGNWKGDELYRYWAKAVSRWQR